MSEIVTASVRALLAGIVDYAGLFPPSQLPMAEAVINYATYKNSNYSWMLGRFIVPVGRLDEFVETAEEIVSRDPNDWRLSVLASEDIDETLRLVEDFNNRYAPRMRCDALEVKANSVALIENIAAVLPAGLQTYFEIPAVENLAEMLVALAIYKQRAKIRTGGVAANAFPPPAQITRFLRTALAANVAFKATAGLHHPVRCVKPLTYEENAESSTMHGFLNFFLAAAFARQGFKPNLLNEILEDEWAENFVFDDAGATWRQEHFVSTAQIKYLREKNAISFGSCSFDEPIADLREIGLL